MNFIRDYQNWRRYWKTVDQLSSLSDAELRDIGLERHAIRDAARHIAR
jgi:uncharacterized protein YjiS (DUF1127 family)